MGTSLSRQEELFVSQQWPTLLDEAILDDQRVEAACSSSIGSGAASNEKSNAPHGFRLSFNEWQALLSILGEDSHSFHPRDAGETASALCERVQEKQLSCPLVVLAVHAYACLFGAITDQELRQRLDSLTDMVHAKQVPTPIPHQDEHGPAEEEEDGEEEEKPKQSKRQRVLRAIQKRVSRNTSSEHPQEAASVALYFQVASLYDHLLDVRGNDEGGSVSTSKRVTHTLKELQSLQPERPVIYVALCFALAAYCIMLPSPVHAEEGTEQLQRLIGAMREKFHGKNNNSNSRRVTDDKANKKSVSLSTLWPSLNRLSTRLAQRQHELDVQQCMSAEGRALQRTLTSEEKSATPLPDLQKLSMAERWDHSMSQYVGQRHVWAALKTHFLSANLFDTEKPTVAIFFGPSGYGKSEMAKRVASAIHACPVEELESSGKLVHIHMPSFCTKDSIYSLVDPPAAHVGDGILLSALRANPDAVVVLDEFEKSTAEAVQHIWLSAFQKNGVLRSLKKADRSISTVKATFILTCNIAADAIASRGDFYLNASDEDQYKMRQLFEVMCRDTCRQTLSDPFTNRVDYFFPFMPYTDGEREQFVCMLLRKLVSKQGAKGRTLHFTPRAVRAMVGELRTFHATTIEEIVRPHLVTMSSAGMREAVITVEKTVEPLAGRHQRYILIPCHDCDASAEGHAVTTEVWTSLPGGSACLRMWEEQQEGQPSDISELPVSGPTQVSEIATKSQQQRHVDAGSHASGVATTRTITGPLQTSADRETLLITQTDREVMLEKELAVAKQTIMAKDMEIATLKEKVLILEKLLALTLLTLLGCCTVLSVIVGLKLTLWLVCSFGFVLVVVLKLPLSVIVDAMIALFNFLGPYKCAALLAALLVWMQLAFQSKSGCP